MIRATIFAGLLLIAFEISARSPVTTRQTHDWDLAVWDRLLASTPESERTVVAGDMILPREFVQKARDFMVRQKTQPEAAFDGGVVLWPGGVIPYSFDPAVSALHQKAFADAAADWATFANLTFVVRTNQTDYVTVRNGTGGNSSAVGKIGGQQFLTITAWTRNVLCHELGHTIGLVHEHQRSDRDGFVTILTQNIQSGAEANFALLPNSNNRGAYDFLSIMHYARHNFANPPTADTIQPKAGFTQYLDIMGNTYGRELSSLDRQGVASIYGAGPALNNVVTNTRDSGPGSLRAAIFYGVDHANTTITFNIPTNDPGHANNVYTIKPTDVMTTPGSGAIISGSTQPNGNPNGPSIVLDGADSPPDFFGPAFFLDQANATLRSLVVVNWPSWGVQITGPGATGNTIAGCYIGLAGDGMTSRPNAFSNVLIENGANGNTIGGTSASDRNVISGATGGNFDGVLIRNAATTNNVVAGNYIGTDRTGLIAVPNSYSGVNIQNGAHGNFIGGAAGNIISGNGQGVVLIDSGTSGNVVSGNLIGLNKDGTGALPNNGFGVSIFNGASANTVGGGGAAARNIISGNASIGVAVIDPGTSANVVSGNYIGLSAGGTTAIPNAVSGVYLFNGATNNTVGGTTASARNFISGNSGNGITLADPATNANIIQGNTIGLTPAGTTVGNGFAGIGMQNGAHGNLVGGGVIGAPNLISGNPGPGIILFNNGTIGNTFQRNNIVGNGDRGIVLSNSGGGSPNNLQAKPTLTSAVLGTDGGGNGITTVNGSLNSTADTNFRVEFYANVSPDPSGFGEGQFFAGETNVMTNAGGMGTFSFQITAAPPGYLISAIATNLTNGNSSEFAQNVTVTTTDTNGDGIPDSWATAHGFAVNATIANVDTDGDGMTNRDEFFAGSDPRNASSVFRITNVARSGGLQLTFNSVTGRVYRAEWRSDLTNGSWQPLIDGIVGTGGSIQLVDLQATGLGKAFYRVRVVPP